jgi:C4-dicarboxylate-specific signal transduction histidine kinase
MRQSEDNQLIVEIVDNGSGIPPDVQAHMFEPFFTTKPVGTGTGLGLIIK